MRSKKILITGTKGFLGSNLFNYLTDSSHWNGYKIIGHSRDKCDLLDPRATREYFCIEKPDYVVHCAALCGGLLFNHSNPGSMMGQNLTMNANVLAGCVDAGVDKVTLIGTPCSYAVDATPPLQEDSLGKGLNLDNATGAYGIAKWVTWQMAEAYSSQCGIHFDYLVPANMYGPGDNFDLRTGHVVGALIRKFSLRNDQVSLVGPKTDTRDFIYVGDVCKAISQALERDTEGYPINIGSGHETSIGELADMVKELTGSKAEIVWEDRNIVGHRRRALNNRRAWVMLCWTPEISLGGGLLRAINWYRRKYPAG